MNDMNQIEIKISNEEINYKEAVLFMESKVRDIIENHSKELLWFLSHNHIFTQGTSASDDEILNSDVIEVLKTNRGGKTTYHGPGQLVGYPILDLRNYKKSISWYMRSLEQVIIDTLFDYNITANRKKGLTGVWCNNEKIAALGVRVSRWITMHGFSLNIDPNLNHYKNIIPCGIFEHGVTSMSGVLNKTVDYEHVKKTIIKKFLYQFSIDYTLDK